MGELKPIGSEKLTGDAKMKRILELTYYQSSNDSKKSIEVVKESKTGVYGIVKEKDGYYVKKGLTESSLDYIGGLFMKNKNRFISYGEALKKVEFLAEQEELQEATKYVLKTKKPEPAPQAEAPVAEPTNEPSAPPVAATASGDGSVPPPEGMSSSPNEFGGDEETSAPEEDYLKVIQKLSGKLQQKLMAYKDKLESKDYKAAIMQVLSGVDLDKLEEADKDEILDKLDPDDASGEPSPETEVPSETSNTTPPSEDELGETDGNAALEELIGTSFFEDEPGSDPFEEDDDESDNFSAIDDAEKAAEMAAQQDMNKEFPSEEKDEPEIPEDLDIPSDTDIVSHRPHERGREEAAEQTAPIPPEEQVKEIDIDELNNMVATGVKETLSKYFEQ
jgi:hypothetical protein